MKNPAMVLGRMARTSWNAFYMPMAGPVSVDGAAESPARRSISVSDSGNDHGSLGLNSERQTQRFAARLPSHPADPLMQK